MVAGPGPPGAAGAPRLRLEPLHSVLKRLPAHPSDWLSRAEARRLEGIGAELARLRFLAGHWLARELLAAFSDARDPRSWQLDQDPGGKPLAIGLDGRPGPGLSLSHSGDWLVCAVARQPLGVDLEQPNRERDLLALANAVCSKREQALLRSVGNGERAALFYRLWTLKEAFVKRSGQGIAPERARGIEFAPASTGTADAWSWQGEDFWLALVTDSAEPPVIEGTVGLDQGHCWRSAVSP